MSTPSNLTVALGGGTSGHDDRSGDDLAEGVVAGMDVDGVQVDVRELGVAQGANTERSDAFVEPGTDS